MNSVLSLVIFQSFEKILVLHRNRRQPNFFHTQQQTFQTFFTQNASFLLPLIGAKFGCFFNLPHFEENWMERERSYLRFREREESDVYAKSHHLPSQICGLHSMLPAPVSISLAGTRRPALKKSTKFIW